jgi:hypothetical protein
MMPALIDEDASFLLSLPIQMLIFFGNTSQKHSEIMSYQILVTS